MHSASQNLLRSCLALSFVAGDMRLDSARRKMKIQNPAKQGEYDGACGFYSIGNALSLLYPKLPIDQIFFEMFSVYNKNYSDVRLLLDGIYRGKLNSILSDTINALQLTDCKIYRPYWNGPASSLNELKQKILENFSNNGSLAIIGYEYSKFGESDWYSHWTVICRATAKTLYTHDSSGESKRIYLSSCRIWDNKSRHKTKPYKLSSTDLFILSRKNDES
jgi:hypothetical protein